MALTSLPHKIRILHSPQTHPRRAPAAYAPMPAARAALPDAVVNALRNAASTDPAYTFGWDTAFAIRVSDVNAELAKPGVCPSQFAASLPDVGDCSGTFGPWRIAVGDDGGDQMIVRMTVPVTKGSLNFQGKAYDMTGGVALIEVGLLYLEHPEVKLESGTRYTLQVQTTPSPGDSNAVLVTRFKHPNDLVGGLAAAILPVWFNEHIAEVNHVFASVDLNVALAQEHLQWLAPTFTGYAYCNGATEADSYLGVLSMTTGRDASGATPQLASSAIPFGERAGFLISPMLMMQHLIVPALPRAFPGTTEAAFGLDADGPTIVNNGDIALAPVTYNGIQYDPVLESLKIRLDGDGLRMETRTRIPISPGITARVEQTSFHQVRVVDRGDGKQTLTLVETEPAESNHWTDVSEGVKILEDVLIVIGIIVDLVLSVLTGGAALVIGAIIVALLFGLASGAPDLIAAIVGEGVSKKSPPLDALVDAATTTVDWGGSKAFHIGSAGFYGSFRMGGDPVFVH